MKGNEKVLTALNGLLSDELAAINQYMVQASVCDVWGYGKLNTLLEAHAHAEMKHAEKLIARILFLEGFPVVTSLDKISIGRVIEDMLANDLALELGAVTTYNSAIAVAVGVGDNATRDLLEGNLEDEIAHIDEIESMLAQIKQLDSVMFLVKNG